MMIESNEKMWENEITNDIAKKEKEKRNIA